MWIVSQDAIGLGTTCAISDPSQARVLIQASGQFEPASGPRGLPKHHLGFRHRVPLVSCVKQAKMARVPRSWSPARPPPCPSQRRAPCSSSTTAAEKKDMTRGAAVGQWDSGCKRQQVLQGGCSANRRLSQINRPQLLLPERDGNRPSPTCGTVHAL